MRIEVGEKLENDDEDVVFSKDMGKIKEMRSWKIENVRKRRGGGAERERMCVEPNRKRRRLRTATETDQTVTRYNECDVDLEEKSGCGTTAGENKGVAMGVEKCSTSDTENEVCGKSAGNTNIMVEYGCGTESKNGKGVATNLERCGISEIEAASCDKTVRKGKETNTVNKGCGTTAKHIKVVASSIIECGKNSGDDKDVTNYLEGCGTAKHDKGLASDVENVSRDIKIDCGTSEPGCG